MDCDARAIVLNTVNITENRGTQNVNLEMISTSLLLRDQEAEEEEPSDSWCLSSCDVILTPPLHASPRELQRCKRHRNSTTSLRHAPPAACEKAKNDSRLRR
jgi:hypothetical protein